MAKLRISKLDKEIIAHRVVSEWVEFATRIISEGGRPVKFLDHMDEAIHANLCRKYPDDERVCEISDRVFNEIRKTYAPVLGDLHF